MASLIVAEAGKPIRQARKEVTRCAKWLYEPAGIVETIVVEERVA